MGMEKLYDAILNGKAILITGSGVNFGSKNIEGEQLPLGQSLAKTLYLLAGVDEPENENDLQDAAENYISKYSEQQLISFLQRKFAIAEISAAAKEIYSLPWLREYTTNYDQMPILAGKDMVVPVTIDSKPIQGNNGSRQCVYINGYLGNLNSDKINSSFKLTTSSYLSAEGVLNSRWGGILKEDLLRASAIVIIGLSLEYDLDLRRIIKESTKDKVYIVDREGINQNKKDKLSRYGTVYDIGIDNFAKEIVDYKDNKFVRAHKNDRLVNFSIIKDFKGKIQKVNSSIMRDFLMWGKFTDDIFEKNLDGTDNIIYRTDINKVIDYVNDGGKRVIFLHSNLGNGKTVFLEQLKRKLYNQGIGCFEYIYKSREAVIDDIETIINYPGKKVIIVENYFNHLSLLKKMANYKLDNIVFILSARTVIYETKLFEAIEALDISEGQSEILDINKLNPEELVACYEMFEKNAFWGKYTGNNNEKAKKKALRDSSKGDCQLRSILLEIMHSNEIQDRLKDLTDTIKKQSGMYYKCIIMMLVSTVMSLELTVEDIQDILGISCIADPLFKENSAVKEIVSINLAGAMNYNICSSIVANEILGLIDSNEEIIDVLIEISRFADKYYMVSEKYEGILKNTVSFSHVKTFLSNKRNNIGFIIDYYEALKTIGFHKNNSFFWLQYSIACMSFGDFDMAQRYVDVAYKLFWKSGDNVPFQCDNQQARIKLLMIIKGVSKDPLKDFNDAHTIAMLPCKNEKDREDSVIQLFDLYSDKALINAMRKESGLDIYKKSCSEAYNRVNDYLKRSRSTTGKDRYRRLAQVLLRCANIT